MSTFTYTGDIQTYTISTTGTYAIDAEGASGGNALGGLGGVGATVGGDVFLQAGAQIEIVVGGEGLNSGVGAGGGGGSFVIETFGGVSTLLAVAGGGGGGGEGTAGGPGQTVTHGQSGFGGTSSIPAGAGGAGGFGGGGGHGFPQFTSAGGGGATGGGGGGGGFSGGHGGTPGTAVQSGIGEGASLTGHTFVGGAGSEAAHASDPSLGGYGGFGGGGGGGAIAHTPGGGGGVGGGGGGGGGYGGGGGGVSGGGGGGGGGSYFDGTPTTEGHAPGDGNGLVTINLVCFTSGSRIRTPAGEVAVEDLADGVLVVTANGEARPVVWTGHRRIERPTPEQWPVRVLAGAFGEGVPERDLRLSPGHAVCVDILGEVFTPIDKLMNGMTIFREAASEVTYWHVELESHDVLLAEGLACESYMDAGNRAFFGREYGLLAEVDTERAAESLARYARPFVDGGPLVTAIRERLAARAMAMRAAGPERQTA